VDGGSAAPRRGVRVGRRPPTAVQRTLCTLSRNSYLGRPTMRKASPVTATRFRRARRRDSLDALPPASRAGRRAWQVQRVTRRRWLHRASTCHGREDRTSGLFAQGREGLARGPRHHHPLNTPHPTTPARRFTCPPRQGCQPPERALPGECARQCRTLRAVYEPWQVRRVTPAAPCLRRTHTCHGQEDRTGARSSPPSSAQHPHPTTLCDAGRTIDTPQPQRAACRSCNSQRGGQRQAQLAEIARQALRARQVRDF
jgi:hypothetical protein